jgi:hypothetical protein
MAQNSSLPGTGNFKYLEIDNCLCQKSPYQTTATSCSQLSCFQKLLIHLFHLPLRHIGPVAAKAAAESMGYMHQFVDEHLCLIRFAELVELFGYDLNDVVGLEVEGKLHDPGQPVTPRQGPPAGRSPAPDTDNPRPVYVGHVELADNVFDLCADILGQFIVDHIQPL